MAAAAALAEEPDRLLRPQEAGQVATRAGDEFSASHAFETGKLAMMIDGEWRVAFVAAEHPSSSTAPRRCRSRHAAEPYGSGYINGTIIGIPKNGKNRDEAWKLVKYLTTNDTRSRRSPTGSATSPRRASSRRRRS